MKLLGKFLIDRGYINSEDYVEAMLHQAVALPPLALAVHDLKLLSIEEQVLVFDYQVHHKLDYRVAAIQLGLWSEAEFYEKLLPYFMERIRTLGDILVEKKKVTLSQLSDALALYIQSEADGTAYLSSEFQKRSRGRGQNGSGEKIIRTKFTSSEMIFVKLFAEYFNEAAKDRLLTLNIKDSTKDQMESLVFIQNIMTALALFKAHQVNEILERLGRWIKEGQSQSTFAKIYEDAWTVMWNLRERFLEGETETGAIDSLSESIQNLRNLMESEEFA